MVDNERPRGRIRRAATRLRDRAAKHRVVTSIVAFLSVLGALTLQWGVPKILDATSSRIGDEIRDRDPVDVAVSSGAITFQHLSSLPRAYVIPRSIDEIPSPSEDDIYDPAWKYDLGGVDAGYTEVQIVVQGRDDSPVIVQDLKIRVTERRDPLSGVYLQEPGGDLLDVRSATVNLDSSPAKLELGIGFEGETWSFPLRVSGTEPEVIHLFANTDACHCFWLAELFFLYRGEPGSITIDNDGDPFETTSPANATSCHYVGGETIPCESL